MMTLSLILGVLGIIAIVVGRTTKEFRQVWQSVDANTHQIKILGGACPSCGGNGGDPYGPVTSKPRACARCNGTGRAEA